ncbi:MAG: hypothetical protein U0457_14945 [Candidatus Sericytochromatia bacterium]
MNKKNTYKLINKLKYFLFFTIILSFSQSFAQTGIGLGAGIISSPIGKDTSKEKFYFTNNYQLNGFTELHENFRINYGLASTFSKEYWVSTPISISYSPVGNYSSNIRPQFYFGFEPFYLNKKANEIDNYFFSYYAFIGFGIDYNIGNNYFINSNMKIYINNSFFQKDPLPTDFSSGTLSLSIYSGYRF